MTKLISGTLMIQTRTHTLESIRSTHPVMKPGLRKIHSKINKKNKTKTANS